MKAKASTRSFNLTIKLTCPHHNTTSAFNSLPFIKSVGLVIFRKGYCCSKKKRTLLNDVHQNYSTFLNTLKILNSLEHYKINRNNRISLKQALHNKLYMLQKIAQHNIRKEILICQSQLRYLDY